MKNVHPAGYSPSYTPTAWTKAEAVAPATFQGGIAVRVCPLCKREIRETWTGRRGANFLVHYKSKACRSARHE